MTYFYQILHIVGLMLKTCLRWVSTFKLDSKWRYSAILDLLKYFISPARLDRFLSNFAGRRAKAIVYIIRVKQCDQMRFRDRCDQMNFRDQCDHMYFRMYLVTQSLWFAMTSTGGIVGLLNNELYSCFFAFAHSVGFRLQKNFFFLGSPSNFFWARFIKFPDFFCAGLFLF